jgi:hypothetical protein
MGELVARTGLDLKTKNIINLGTLNTHTVPGGTGTIALTSNLSAYLPLAGGTMSGNIVMTGGNIISGGTSVSASALLVSGGILRVDGDSDVTVGVNSYVTIYETGLTAGDSGKFLIKIQGLGAPVLDLAGFEEWQWVVDGSGTPLSKSIIGVRLEPGASTADCVLEIALNGANIRVRAKSVVGNNWNVKVCAMKL